MKGPVAIPLTPTGTPDPERRGPRAFAATEVQPLTEIVESYSDPLPEAATLPAAPRMGWLARLLWGTAGLLISLGLGLAITRRLVEMHDGTIGATSPGKDRGASFTVELAVEERRGENGG